MNCLMSMRSMCAIAETKAEASTSGGWASLSAIYPFRMLIMPMVIEKEGSKWVLYSKDRSKTLGTFRTKKDAMKRERQINYFKHLKGRK